MSSLAIRRSAWRMWGTSLLGVPMVVVAVDVLTTNRLTNWLRAVVFGTDDSQVLEPRDRLWAAVLGIVGLILVLWGLWELVRPRTVVSANGDGITVELRGPLLRPTRIPWDLVDDVGAGVVDDSGTDLPVLWIKVTDPARLPAHPWGARMISPGTLAILAVDWEIGADEAAAKLVDVAMARLSEADEAEPSEVEPSEVEAGGIEAGEIEPDQVPGVQEPTE